MRGVAALLLGNYLGIGASFAATVAPLPEPYSGHALLASGGHLYNIGGIGGWNGFFSGDRVYYGALSADGSVSAWLEGDRLPEPAFWHAAVAAQGALYVIGGYHYNSATGVNPSNHVYWTKPGADGRPASWQAGPSLPESLFFPSAAAWGGRLYVIGGWNGSNLTSAVYSAQLLADGSLSAWRTERTLPEGVYTHAAVSQGTLYVLGGSVNGGLQIHDAVWAAPIRDDGTLDPWRSDSPLPEPLSNHAAVIAGGRVYVAGGWNGMAASNVISRADITGSGELTTWARHGTLPSAIYQLGAATWANRLYISGGSDGNTPHDAVHVFELPEPLPPPLPADRLPPRTSLAIEGARYGEAPIFIAPSSRLALQAQDDRLEPGDGAGEGVAQTNAGVASEPSPVTGAIDPGPEGARWVSYYSVDLVGNSEPLRVSSVAVDATAPLILILAGAPSVGDVVSPATVIAISAEDPVSGGVASGLAEVNATVDGAPADPAGFTLAAGLRRVAAAARDQVGNEARAERTFVVDGEAPVSSWTPAGGLISAASAIELSATDTGAGLRSVEWSLDGAAWNEGPRAALPEGVRALYVRAVDNVGNVEASRSAEFRVDGTAPQTTLETASRVTPETPVTLTAVDPAVEGVSAGVARILYAVDGGAAVEYTGPFSLAAGEHVVRFHAVDLAGNVEDERSVTLHVSPADTQAPVTTLSLGDPSVEGFVSPATPLTLSATDDRSGLSRTQWALDDGAFADYAAAFTIAAEGAHWVRAFSVDGAGNAETPIAVAVSVDATAPTVSIDAGSPRAELSDGSVVVGPATTLAVAAQDPISGGVASGLASVTASVDSVAVDATGFKLTRSGENLIRASASDRLGHAASAERRIWLDSAAPVTTLTPAGLLGASGLVAVSSEDDLSGVNRIERSVDGGAWAAGGDLALDEGEHVVRARAVDNVGNVEAEQEARYTVDATPPVSTLEVSAGQGLFGRETITPETPVTLGAEDPISNGVASGLARLLYSVDGGAQVEYAGPFRLSEGEHVVRFHAVDRAGNVEAAQESRLAVGRFLTDTLAAKSKVTLSGKAEVNGSVSAPSIEKSGQAKITGGVRESAPADTLDIAAAKAWAQANKTSSLSKLLLNDKESLTLGDGVYYFSELTLKGQSKLEIGGQAQVFVAGPISVGGQAELNSAGSASALWLVSDGASASFAGQARAAFHLYAPSADVSFTGQGQFAGRLLGNTVSLSGQAAVPPGETLPERRKQGKKVLLAKGSPAPREVKTKAKLLGKALEVLLARLDEARPEAKVERKHEAGSRVKPTSAAPALKRRSEPALKKVAAALKPQAASRAPAGPPAARIERRRVVPALSAPPVVAAALRALEKPRRLRSAKAPQIPLSARAAFSVAPPTETVALRAKDRSGIVIPEGAVKTPLAVTVLAAGVEHESARAPRETAAKRAELKAAGAAVEYGPEGTKFEKPVTLELPYDRSLGLDEATLAVHYWNPRRGEWERLASSVDRAAGVVRAQTDHFSLYQVMSGTATAAAGEGAFVFGEVYAFPNPARPGQRPAFKVEAPGAESITVTVYDVAGQRVHQGNPAPGVDHVWDTAGVGSGVYLYIVQARRGGETITKRGKMAVIK